MIYQIAFTPLALQELQDAKDYLNEQSDALRDSFLVEFLKVTDLLIINPFVFQKIYKNKRRAIVRKFQYNIIYTVQDDVILLLGILHGARNPAIWKNR